MNKQLGDIRHVALDMDGTIYSGGTLFESTLPFLAVLRELLIQEPGCHHLHQLPGEIAPRHAVSRWP
jgi:NagD protein